MPNWCEGSLEIYGEKDEIKRFRIFAKGENGVLDANKFLPYPSEFLFLDKKAKRNNEKYWAVVKEATKHIPQDMPAGEERNKQWEEATKNISLKYMQDGYNQGGYGWCCENWGTKWNFCDAELLSDKETSLYYIFNTAWSPITPVIAKMASEFPRLCFKYKYSEEGMGFSGGVVFENAECVQDAQYSY